VADSSELQRGDTLAHRCLPHDRLHTLSTTKNAASHRLKSLRTGAGAAGLGPTRPNPFRRYEGAKRIELPLLADGLETRYNALRRGRMPAPRAFDVDSIAIFFELSSRISAWKIRRNTWRCAAIPRAASPSYRSYLVTGGVPALRRVSTTT